MLVKQQLLTLLGVYEPTEGDILFNGEKINGKRPDEIAKLGIASTFQNIRLFKDLTVLENVLIAMHLNIKSGFFTTVLKLPKARKEEKEMIKFAEFLLEETEILEHTKRCSYQSSFGLIEEYWKLQEL